MFKKGDKVRCISGQEYNYLRQGAVYTIKRCYMESTIAMVLTEELDGHFFADRFKLIKSKIELKTETDYLDAFKENEENYYE